MEGMLGGSHPVTATAESVAAVIVTSAAKAKALATDSGVRVGGQWKGAPGRGVSPL